MAYRIQKTFPEQVGKHTKGVKEPDYLSWVRQLPCVLTGTLEVDAAHVSYAAPEYAAHGRGKSQKVSDKWVLPLSRQKHRDQHLINEKVFWKEQGIDPHLICLVLFSIYNELGDDGLPVAARYLRDIRHGAVKQSGGIARQYEGELK